MTWFGLITDLRSWHSRAVNLSARPHRFKGLTKLFREGVLVADSMAAESQQG